MRKHSDEWSEHKVTSSIQIKTVNSRILSYSKGEMSLDQRYKEYTDAL